MDGTPLGAQQAQYKRRERKWSCVAPDGRIAAHCCSAISSIYVFYYDGAALEFPSMALNIPGNDAALWFNALVGWRASTRPDVSIPLRVP